MFKSTYKVALYSDGSIHIISDINCLFELFEYILQFDVNGIVRRLACNFVREAELSSTLHLLEEIHNNCDKKFYNVLNKLINAYRHLIELYNLSSSRNEEYDPIRFIIFDEPFCTISDNIPLEDYDNNDGEPFWMRPKYILDHYSKSNKNI